MKLYPTAWRTVLLSALMVSGTAQAFTFGIQPGSRLLYLRVGQGTWQHAGDNLTMGSDATVNTLAVQVPAAAVGNAVPQTMAMVMADTQPSESCQPSEVVVGVLYKRGNNGNVATLTATPGTLTNGTSTIPFSQIGWVSSSSDPQAMPSGAFTGASQSFAGYETNTYYESCLTFRYANTAVVEPGTYSGRVTYTLSAP